VFRRLGVALGSALLLLGIGLTTRAVLPGSRAAVAEVETRGAQVPSNVTELHLDPALVRQAQARAEERVRVASYLAALAEFYRPKTGVNWDGIARCETGGNWAHQTQYDGGLGILHAAWVEFGGRQFAEYGSQATREQQIVVAERIHARHGLSGWGCKAYG